MATSLERYRERRAYSIAKLGGKCVRCGATKNLQLDHIDKYLKSFNITAYWSYSLEKYDVELAKCQLLCKSCHKEKSNEEKDFGALGYGYTHHGTASMYRESCRCNACRLAYNEEARKYRALQRLNKILEE